MEALQSIQSPPPPKWENSPKEVSPSKPTPEAPSSSTPSRVSVSGYVWHQQKVELYAKNSQGDTLEISYEASTKLEFSMENADSKEVDSFLDKIDQYISEQHDKLFKELLKQLQSDSQGVRGIGGQEIDPVYQVPEYWNPENTSNRIVNFALSFFEISGLSQEEYADKVLNAIKKGFEDAKKMLGQLPPETEKLLNDTHQLALEKIQSWKEDASLPQSEKLDLALV